MKKLPQLIRFLSIKQNVMEVYYIQGDNAPPKPLDREEGLAVLIALENGGEEARNTLIERNLRLVVYIAERYETNPISVENLISIGSVGLIKAINTFKWGRDIKLVTYASHCIENEILMFLCKKSCRKVEISFNEPLNIDYDGSELLLSDILGTDDDVVIKESERKGNKRELLEVMSTLKEWECQIPQMHCGIQYEELIRKSTAKRLGISQSYVSRLEKRIITKLEVQMKNSQ